MGKEIIGFHSSKGLKHWGQRRVNADVNRVILGQTGGHLNKKDGLTRYGDSHVKDKTS